MLKIAQKLTSFSPSSTSSSIYSVYRNGGVSAGRRCGNETQARNTVTESGHQHKCSGGPGGGKSVDSSAYRLVGKNLSYNIHLSCTIDSSHPLKAINFSILSPLISQRRCFCTSMSDYKSIDRIGQWPTGAEDGSYNYGSLSGYERLRNGRYNKVCI